MNARRFSRRGRVGCRLIIFHHRSAGRKCSDRTDGEHQQDQVKAEQLGSPAAGQGLNGGQKLGPGFTQNVAELKTAVLAFGDIKPQPFGKRCVAPSGARCSRRSDRTVEETIGVETTCTRMTCECTPMVLRVT